MSVDSSHDMMGAWMDETDLEGQLHLVLFRFGFLDFG